MREGIRRIGKVIYEQIALYGTLTGEMPAVSTEELEIARPADDTEPGRRGRRAPRARPAPRRRRMSRVAVLKGGRSLERQVSLRSGAEWRTRWSASATRSSASTSAAT